MTFAVFSELTKHTDESLYNVLYSQIQGMIEVKLGNIFQLQNTTERYYGQNMDRVDIGFWQKPNLVVKLGDTTLTEFIDYKLQTYKDTNVVLGIQLNRIFNENEYLEITGDKGWANTIPDDLNRFIFDYINKGFLSHKYTASGAEGLKMIENHSSKEAFDNTAQRKNAEFLMDPFGSKAWRSLSRKYKYSTNKVICTSRGRI